MKRLILASIMLLAMTVVSKADPITLEAAVNAPRISLDEVMQLTLTITGVNDNLDPVSLPVIDGFSAKYLGPSTSVSIINGDYHSERSFIYNLFPNKVGRFQIPPISATISGQNYTTKPINVEVVQETTQAAAAPAGSGTNQSQAPSADSLKDKVLIMVSVDKTDAYLNERVPVSIKLLVNDVPVRDIQFPQFDKTGMLADDFEKPIQSSQVVNGVNYDTVEFKTNIYPNRLGDLTIGPVQILGNVLYKTGSNNPFGQNSGFGGDVFNNFFDTYANRPITITSQPISIHVLPLPDANQPQDFSGAIGQFDFQATAAPAQVKAGDPLTLKMDIKGNGNFKNLKMPVFQDTGFKSYSPQIKNSGDEKTAEEVIIPISAGTKEVPALHFSYFDPSIKDYKTITQGPFPIQVSAPNPDQDFKAVGFSNLGNTPAAASQFSVGGLAGQTIAFISRLFKSVWFWILFGITLMAVISYLLWRRFQQKLINDPAFARRLKAIREAKQAFAPAQGYIAAGRDKEFYALLSKVLRDYLANKWHQSSAALSVEEIISHLKTAKMDDAHISQIRTLLEQSDMVCFAGAHRDANQMNGDLIQAQELIAHLEKSL